MPYKEDTLHNKVLSEESIRIISEVPIDREDLIIPTLQKIQMIEGFIPEACVNKLASQIDTKPAHIYGVATFYNQFRLTPVGKHIIKVCRGTACHVKGSDQIVQALATEFDVAAGDTTADKLFSLRTARCLGSCGLAPVVVLNGQVSARETPDAVVKRVKEVISLSKEKLQQQEVG